MSDNAQSSGPKDDPAQIPGTLKRDSYPSYARNVIGLWASGEIGYNTMARALRERPIAVAGKGGSKIVDEVGHLSMMGYTEEEFLAGAQSAPPPLPPPVSLQPTRPGVDLRGLEQDRTRE
jgi:hypothetical protein